MGLQKAVQFLTSGETQKLTQLRFAEPTSLVLFQTEGFQGSTGEVTA